MAKEGTVVELDGRAQVGNSLCHLPGRDQGKTQVVVDLVAFSAKPYFVLELYDGGRKFSALEQRRAKAGMRLARERILGQGILPQCILGPEDRGAREGSRGKGEDHCCSHGAQHAPHAAPRCIARAWSRHCTRGR